MFRTDICIAGAGIIGLSLALDLESRGLSVLVLEAGTPMSQASTAAAGMLAADDPHNPAELAELAHLSTSLYPTFLRRIEALSGSALPFQTSRTLQVPHTVVRIEDRVLKDLAHAGTVDDALALSCGFTLLRENSIDPRQLASSLLAAMAATSVTLSSNGPVLKTHASTSSVIVSTPLHKIEAAHFVDCTGAWASDPAFRVVPIKGQMLSVALPPDLPLKMTLRTRDIYIVPRTIGPNAGRAIIGATVEDAGFDKTVHSTQIEALHRHAAMLLPPLAHAPILESWAGLRPATADRLPLLGAHPDKLRHWVATGHYRNGVLLAPATALVMAQLILNQPPSAPLEVFSAARNAIRKTQPSH